MKVRPVPELTRVAGTGAAKGVDPFRLRDTQVLGEGGRGQDYRAREVDGIESVHQERVRVAYHSIFLADCADGLLIVAFALAPCVLLTFGYFAELCVELCALFVVGFEALAAVGAEGVFI